MTKKIELLILIMILATYGYAQQQDCIDCGNKGNVDDTEYKVIKTKDMMYEGEFVPGEVLVKFKDEFIPALRKGKSGYAVTGVSSVDMLFEKYKVTEAKKIFPNAVKKTSKESFTTFNGKTVEVPNLHNIRKITTEEENANIYEIVRELKENENVEYAEPNYIYAIVEDEPISPELTESEMLKWIKGNPNKNIINTPAENSSVRKAQSTVTPNDPLYSQQWGIPACQIDAVWDSTTGSSDQIIAILDTGVDWLHPDLENKIWENSGEIADNGIDDDGNGYIDDIRGWDWINNDNNPTDDNSHGTHVAGIAAAETDNGIGIAGVNWLAKVMPLKVFQSSGKGDAATITEAIIYAKEKGATVINMSFSSSSRSSVMEDALADAYANTVLVASAGNDGKCIGPGSGCARYYPAAISYVLGVEATASGGVRTAFSNFDQDGPVYSEYEDLNNYELKAPGANIISSIPNGNYRAYNGTSMSTPLVAGAVSLDKILFPEQSQEMMWGNFINTISNHIQVFDAMNIEADPVLWFVSNTIVDTLDGDEDGRIDAGETIELWFDVRNTWGQSDSVWCGIRFGEFEDRSTASILQDKTFIGSVSPYARKTNESNPLKIKIDHSVPHDRDIVFEALLWYKGASDTVKQEVVLTVEKGEELSGIFSDSLTLTPDKFWLISGSFKVTDQGVIIIKPGTHLEIKTKLINDGQIIAHGTRDSMIVISGTCINAGSSEGFLDIKYTMLDLSLDGTESLIYDQIGSIAYSNITLNGHYGFRSTTLEISNCTLSDWIVSYPLDGDNLYYKCNIENISSYHLITNDDEKLAYCNINKFVTLNENHWSRNFPQFVNSNNILGSNNDNIYHTKDGYYEYIQNQYWGTSDSVNIENRIYDFKEDAEFSRIVFTPYLTQPTDSAHGCVWKVLVDGIDPQDEVLDPIGAGSHRFDVYFNRAMDTEYTPSLSFGVSDPYTQQSVTDSSFWSADSMIWTAYKTIQLHTGDGINRIRVANARDTEDFEIPTEDQRFEFVIDAAGLSSVDFNATAGLGKIALDWIEPEDVSDLLGYNIYRFTNITDTTYSDTLMINSEMILDNVYTDYDVVPGSNYYYQYTVVKTDFSESDKSMVIGSKALTASPGDANGDLEVNVLDITSVVNYLLNKNPQPFIYEAGDVNGDASINVLDIVGIVNVIMGTSNNLAKSSNTPIVTTSLTNVSLENGERIVGLQFKLVGNKFDETTLTKGIAAKNMELVYNIVNDTLYAVLFSYNGNTIGDGEIFRINEGNLTELTEIIASDYLGNQLEIKLSNDGTIVPKEFQLFQNYPNPFNPNTTIKYALPNVSNVEIHIYNILGQRIKTFYLPQQNIGFHQVIWDSKNDHGSRVGSGVYIYQIKVDTFLDAKKMILLK